MECDDKELIRRLKNGNTKAMDDIFRRHYRPLVGFFYGKTRQSKQNCDNNLDPEDLAQLTLIRVYVHIESYHESEAPFSYWLFKTANSVLSNERGKKNRKTVDYPIRLGLEEIESLLICEDTSPEDIVLLNEKLEIIILTPEN